MFDPAAVSSAFTDATINVLETMFFTSVTGDSTAADGRSALGAEVRFRGTTHGSMALSLPEESARNMAHAFLGVEPDEPLPPERVQEMVCELANMICGCALSHLGKGAAFDLHVAEAPALDTTTSGWRFLNLEDGVLAVRHTVGD